VTLGAGFRCKQPASNQQQQRKHSQQQQPQQQQQQQHESQQHTLNTADSVIDLGSADCGTDGASSAFELQPDEPPPAATAAVAPALSATASTSSRSSSARRSHSAASSRTGRKTATLGKQQQQQQQQQQHTAAAAAAAAVAAMAVSGKSYRPPAAQSRSGNVNGLNLPLTSAATSVGGASPCCNSARSSSTHSSAGSDAFDADPTADAAADHDAVACEDSVHSANLYAATGLSGARLATPELCSRRPDIWGTGNGSAAEALPQDSAAASRRDTFMLRPAKLSAIVTDVLTESLRSFREIEHTE
jgi:hypothetical protein